MYQILLGFILLFPKNQTSGQEKSCKKLSSYLNKFHAFRLGIIYEDIPL
jgi:hypothetical protein